MHLYNEMVDLDTKTTSIYQITKESSLLLINKQLREWITHLKVKCPPVEELDDIKFILQEHEHTINK